MTLAICVATMQSKFGSLVTTDLTSNLPGEIPSWTANAVDSTIYNHVHILRNSAEKNLGIVGSYEELYKQSDEDVLCYLHDDVVCREEGWDERVRKEFEDPAVGVVGFGGANEHGRPGLYKTPYRLTDLARNGYLSNVDDAEVHGKRFEGSRDVAVLDGFVLVVRRTLLQWTNGWTFIPSFCGLFCYDYAICAMARRLGYRIRLIGIRCHHLGGTTSVIQGEVASVSQVVGQEAYDRSHRWFYDEFKDVMPARVK